VRSPFRKLVALCLLWLAFWPPPASYRDTPPPIPSTGTPPIQWSELAARKRNLDQFYFYVSNLPAPKAKPAPRVRSAPSSAPVAYDPGSVEATICGVFGDNCGHALAIARCESGLDPNARNRSGAAGLFQIMMPMHADLFNRPEDVFDPLENSRAAFDLSHGGTNWSAWVCR
jgi:soluble lytic murein transglycosylase-like protein